MRAAPHGPPIRYFGLSAPLPLAAQSAKWSATHP